VNIRIGDGRGHSLPASSVLGLVLGMLAVMPSYGNALAMETVEASVLKPKNFGLGGRHQFALLASTSMATKYVESTGPWLAYLHNFNDILGFEVSGAYFFSSETNIMQDIRSSLGSEEPGFSDLYQMQWNTSLNLVLVPFYGKLSIVRDWETAFDVFIVAGGGVGGTRRRLGNDNATVRYDTAVVPTFDFGAGLRFFMGRLVALRFEFRDYLYPDPDPNFGGLTSVFQFQGGLQFQLGGDR
jgi:outer membrane beta-barrel protein